MENDWWYGIPGIEFIWRGEWADPEICYEDMIISAPIVEDTMWERYRDECGEFGMACELRDGFGEYMRENSDEVKYLIEVAWESYQ